MTRTLVFMAAILTTLIGYGEIMSSFAAVGLSLPRPDTGTMAYFSNLFSDSTNIGFFMVLIGGAIGIGSFLLWMGAFLNGEGWRSSGFSIIIMVYFLIVAASIWSGGFAKYPHIAITYVVWTILWIMLERITVMSQPIPTVYSDETFQ